MKWLNWLADIWHARQRSVDLDVLWPTCKAQAPDMYTAKLVFSMHAFQDEAWTCLGEAEIRRRIDELQ